MTINLKRNHSKPSDSNKLNLGVTKQVAMNLYSDMLGIRLAQESLIDEYHPADEMRCPVHFCVGQEAPPAGVCRSLNEGDLMFTGHRSHGYYLAKGGSINGLFAELYGRSTGSNRGLAGSMEICDEAVNFYSGTILAGTLPIAAGAALTSKMRGENRVTVAVLGDGVADEGIVYETLNFAALKRLPMVFICENNSYSAFSRQEDRQGLCDLAGRAKAFGVPSRRLSGNDVLTVYKAARRAINKARKGEGPTFLELDTYRWCGHVGPEDDDEFNYRSMDELEQWKKDCPIEKMLEILMEGYGLNNVQIAEIERSERSKISDAFTFAKASPFPSPDILMEHVLSSDPPQTSIKTINAPDIAFDFLQPEAVPRPY